MGVAAFTWFRWQLSRGMGGRFHWNTQSAHQDFGLLAEHYQTRDHVLVDQRTGRADSSINFAYHVLNLSMKKSIEWVAYIQGLSKTIENEDEDDHNDELGIR